MNLTPLLSIIVVISIAQKVKAVIGYAEDSSSIRNCSDPENAYLPPTATNTTMRLKDLRREMDLQNISAYIIPSSDPHLSEYTANRDRKRQWITGFTGSAGTAVVTMDKAAVWTDGRYFLQAETQLDCNWLLMKLSTPGYLTIDEWIISELPQGSTIGAHSFLFSVDLWQSYSESFSKKNLIFEETIPDLIDLIWTDRPELSTESLLIHPLEYAGKSWQTKLSETRDQMREQEANYLLLTKLDEVAWFFNLRGNDVPNTPVFTAYVILPLEAHVIIYANQDLFRNDAVKSHLNETDCKSSMSCVIVKPYEDARMDLTSFSSNQNDIFWLSKDSTTFAMYSVVDEKQQISSDSPIQLAKSIKNPTEIEVMKKAHIYDAVALCQYLQWLEINVPLGNVDEISGAEVLKSFRLSQPTNQGLSFGSISASGPNGAIIHYGATAETNRNLTIDEMYLVDSGGQYLGGTTDVTRTMHFGEPTAFEKETFTRVLMGMIDTEKSVFPYDKRGYNLDVLARRYLYDVGLEYGHRTGHGIGLFLSIHEAPPGFGTSTAENNYSLQPGMFTSIEPGYYEAGSFGLRNENINLVVEATTKYQFENYKFYTFEPVTLVPFQRKLIEIDLMSNEQIAYLNDYHAKVSEVIGAEAEKQSKPELKQWIVDATAALPTGASSRVFGSIYSVLGWFILALMSSHQFI